MLIERLVAQYFGTNCWILAPKQSSECIVVDPGIAVPDFVPQILAATSRLNLKPVAVLITHGHVDHTYSLFPLSQQGGVSTCYIHSDDRALLANPEKGLGPQGLALMKELAPEKKWYEPDRVIELHDGTSFEVAGLSIESLHAPGHTAGSTMFKIDSQYLLSGDVLFKGAIGRTDLPTSDPAKMNQSLKRKVLTLSDEIKVLPGHGDVTTIGEERANNPFLIAVNG